MALRTRFPERVWFPTGNGWASREPTAADWRARFLCLVRFDSVVFGVMRPVGPVLGVMIKREG